MADVNIFKNGGFVFPSENSPVKINEKVVKKSLEHIAAPVFEFFTKGAEKEPAVTDYDGAISSQEMKNAVVQKILNDADPASRSSFNIVI